MTYKIILAGDGGVGKSSWLRKNLTNGSESLGKYYFATVGAEVHPYKYNNTIMNIWDIGGQDRYTGLRHNYYKDADAAIIMFDVTHNRSYRNVEKWITAIRNINPEIPIVIVGNKCEPVTPLNAHINMQNLQYFPISVKNNYNISEPFTWLVQNLE